MSEVLLIETRRVALADIHVGDRLRPVNEHGVAVLVSSIEAIGGMQSEILLRRVRRKGAEGLELIAGGHRLAAARELGWEDIPAKIYEMSARMARLWEVDDNLANAELSFLEQAVFFAERKRVYLELYPETAQGKAGAAGRWDDASDIASFASVISEKRGMSRRNVERLIAVGERLDKSTIATLSGKSVKLKDLTDLSRIPDPMTQVRAASALAHDGAKSVSEAVRKLNGDPPKPKPTPQDAAYAKLMDAWTRAPKAAQRSFLNELWRINPGLMSEEAMRAERERAE